jgi:AcrR family transcriptional regulator
MVRKPEKTRERIFDAALSCFEEFGFRKTSVDEIARLAGVGKGTVYLHFKDKEDLFLAVLQHKTEQLREAAAVGVYDEKDTISGIVRMAHNVIGFIKDNPFFFNTLRNIRELGLTHLQPQLTELIDSVLTIKENIIIRGIEKGDIKPVNSLLLAFVLNKAFESFFLSPRPEGLDVSPDEYVVFIEKLLREGIASDQ